jgi:hypothetical protein
MFSVTKNGIRHYIDSHGNILLETAYIGNSNFSEGKAQVYINGKIGFIDTNGDLVIDPIYEACDTDFQGGYCGVKLNGKYGFIDTTGEFIIPPEYYRVGQFSYGLVGVLSGNLEDIHYINNTGKVFIQDSGLAVIRNYSEGLLVCCDDRRRYGFRNTKGEWAISPKYPLAANYSEGLAGVHYSEKSNVKTAFIDHYGKEVIPPLYETVLPKFRCERAVVIKKMKGGYKRGCIDRKGNLVVPFDFKRIDDFSDGLAAVRMDGRKYGFINTNGEIQISPIFDKVWFPFRDGLAVIEKEGKIYYINKTGDIIWEFS